MIVRRTGAEVGVGGLPVIRVQTNTKAMLARQPINTAMSTLIYYS